MAVRIGVVGVGALGFHHARQLRDVPDATLVGFYDSNADRALAVGTELGLTSFASLDARLDVVDAVTVGVPTPAHFAVATEALGRGKHVLLQKPIGAMLEQADKMLAIGGGMGAPRQLAHV